MTTNTLTIRAGRAGTLAFDHGCFRTPMLDSGFTGLIIDLDYHSDQVATLKAIWIDSWDAAKKNSNYNH